MTRTEFKADQMNQLRRRLQEQRRPREEARRLAEIHAAKPWLEKMDLWWSENKPEITNNTLFFMKCLYRIPMTLLIASWSICTAPARSYRLNKEWNALTSRASTGSPDKSDL